MISYLRGDESALTEEQKEGLQLFVDNGCAGCHSGINVGGDQYQPFGVVELPGAEFLPPDDKGRFEVTKSVSDEYVFKVPTLRNIELTPPYFHTGRSWDLRQAVAVMGASQLGIELTDEEVDKITAFLGSLTGEQPEVTYPSCRPRSQPPRIRGRSLSVKRRSSCKPGGLLASSPRSQHCRGEASQIGSRQPGWPTMS